MKDKGTMKDKVNSSEKTETKDKTEYVEDLMGNFLKETLSKSAVKTYNVQLDNSKGIDQTERINRLIKNVNNEFLIHVLSPEIQKNEEKKRKHKDWLMIIMGLFLLFQFILVAIIICALGYFVVKAHLSGNPFSDSTIRILFTFIGSYITSLIIELIAILRYIVKNVFDTSVAGMVNNFKDNN